MPNNQERNRWIQRKHASNHGLGLLEGELSSLWKRPTSAGSPRRQALTESQGLLTARTRNNEVFPAFCRPTMVTSISIALMPRRQFISIVEASGKLPRWGNKTRRARPHGSGKHPAHGPRPRLLTRTCAAANHRPSGRVQPCFYRVAQAQVGSRRKRSDEGGDCRSIDQAAMEAKTPAWGAILTRRLVWVILEVRERRRDGERCGGRGALWKANYCWRSDKEQGRRTGVRLRKKSDLYNGGSRQVTSAAGKRCAPASGRRGRESGGDGLLRRRGSWCNDGEATDWHEVTPERTHKKSPT